MTSHINSISAVTAIAAPAGAQTLSSVGSQQKAQSSASTAKLAAAAASQAPARSAPKSGLQINLDANTSQVVIQVVTGGVTEIIRRIPAEEVEEFARTLDSSTGNLIKAKA